VRRGGLAALLSLATLLAGCAFPVLRVEPIPGRRLALLPGARATVTVSTTDRGCPEPRVEEVCVDVTGQVLQYVVQNLPPGVTSRIDTSLQSPGTPGVVRITFEAEAGAPPELREVLILAGLPGRPLGAASLVLQVLPALGTAPTAPLTAIEAAGTFSLAVLADGSAWSWGNNDDGQLGLGDVTSRLRPAPVSLPAPLTAVSGAGFPGGHALGLAADGTVWGWGSNGDGQLGLGDTVDRHVPTRVPGLPGIGAVAAGLFSSMALAHDGTVWTWGRAGALGDRLGGRTVPRQVPGLIDIQAIAFSGSHALALGGDGTVWTWGSGRDGLMGDGTEISRPTPGQVPALGGIQAVAAGRDHSLALAADGTVWAWGANSSGQVGDGTTLPASTPVQVSGLTDVRAIAAGSDASLAVRADGTLWVWGERRLLGDGGTGSDLTTPRQVPGLGGVRAVAADRHVLALLDCGQLYAWGDDHHGQLGDGTIRTEGLTPVLVARLGTEIGCDRVALQVDLAGDGAGTLSADVGGLGCTERQCTGFFAPGSAVTLTASAGGGSMFEGWAVDCQGAAPDTTVVLDSSKQCAAGFRLDAVPFRLSVVKSGGGRVTSSGGGMLGPDMIDCGATCSAIFPRSTQVTLAAAAASGFEFAGWAADCTGAAAQTAVVMDDHHTCRAEFRAFTLAASVAGGGRVTSDPPGLDCTSAGGTCSVEPRAGTATLTAEPDPGWRFDGWGGDCTGTGLQLAVTMDADQACTATFSRIPDLFSLMVVVEGDGSVTSAPAGIDCPGTCLALLPRGPVTLSAQPTESSEILGWFEDCAAPGVPTTQLVMDADRTCRIRFATRRPFPVAVFNFTPGPHVAGVPVAFDGSGSHVLDPVTGAQDHGGITLFSWDFDGDGLFEVSGSRATAAFVQHTYQAPGVYSVRLRVRGGPFDLTDDSVQPVTVLPATFTLTVSHGGGGRVVSTPAGLDCGGACSQPFPALGAVALEATPDPGFRVDGWTGCDAVSPSGLVCTVTLLSDRAVGVTFTSVPAGVTACLSSIIQTTSGPFVWEVQADGSCSTGPIAQYRWWTDFNFAGQLPAFITTTPVPPPFLYEVPGTYDIRLEVNDEAGDSHAIVVPFTVQ
jgi:alpha-tubulin suppressor-like RCC1 family protein/PKD repeat protein